MKRATSVQFLEDGGVIHTVVLGGDHTAEHEGGCDDIKNLLGIPAVDALGIEGRSMGKPLHDQSRVVMGESKTKEHSPNQHNKSGWEERTSNVTFLLTDRYGEFSNVERINTLLKRHQRHNNEEEATAIWGWNGFSIVGFSDRARSFIEVLNLSILKGDFAVWSGRFSANPFDPRGLVLSVPSLVPDRFKKILLEADEARRSLASAAVATGIADRLKLANYEYHALSPAWAEKFGDLNGRKLETVYPVVFFLNPRSGTGKFGWYTVEELDQWIVGAGPVTGNTVTDSAPSP